MSKFKVWIPDRGYLEEAARTVESFDAESAAEVYCERNHGEHDYPDEFERVHVRDEDGKVTVWNVTVEPNPLFRATEAKP